MICFLCRHTGAWPQNELQLPHSLWFLEGTSLRGSCKMYIGCPLISEVEALFNFYAGLRTWLYFVPFRVCIRRKLFLKTLERTTACFWDTRCLGNLNLKSISLGNSVSDIYSSTPHISVFLTIWSLIGVIQSGFISYSLSICYLKSRVLYCLIQYSICTLLKCSDSAILLFLIISNISSISSFNDIV